MHKGSLRTGILLFLEEMEQLHGGMAYRLQHEQVEWPGYPKKTWNEIIQRMVEDGELREERNTIGLTRIGRARVYALQPARIHSNKKWDGRWRMITFEIPEKARVRRNQLRNLLNDMGFGMWQRSLYVHTYPLMGFVEEYAKQLGVMKNLRDWEVEIKGNGKSKELVELVFKQDLLAEAGKKLLTNMKALKSMQGKRLLNGQRKWMQQWQKFVFADPLLPKELRSEALQKIKLELLERVERLVMSTS